MTDKKQCKKNLETQINFLRRISVDKSRDISLSFFEHELYWAEEIFKIVERCDYDVFEYRKELNDIKKGYYLKK